MMHASAPCHVLHERPDGDIHARIITALPEKPVIMGQSFGGTPTQLLVDRGHGTAGVVVHSAPPEGIRVNPPSRITSLFPILDNPGRRPASRARTTARSG